MSTSRRGGLPRAPELPQAALHSLMARVVQRVHQLDVDAQPRLLTLVQGWFGSEAFPQAEERNAVFGIARGAGLYDPEHESDSCGVAMVADIQGRRSHAIVADGLTALEHLEHRGAAGAEPNSGDGAGILLQLPVELLREVVDFELPVPDQDGSNTFAAGICFLPQDPWPAPAASRPGRGHRRRRRAGRPRLARRAGRSRRRRSRYDGAGLHAPHVACCSSPRPSTTARASAASTSIAASTRCASAPRRSPE